MFRIITLTACFLATALLFPVQTECSEIAECEPETEIECCFTISAVRLKSESAEEISGRPVIAPEVIISCPSGFIYSFPDIITAPARLLHCVFRE